jgi:hypothetical protein
LFLHLPIGSSEPYLTKYLQGLNKGRAVWAGSVLWLLGHLITGKGGKELRLEEVGRLPGGQHGAEAEVGGCSPFRFLLYRNLAPAKAGNE